MFKSTLPDLISDLNNTNLNNDKLSKSKVKFQSQYSVQELLKRCNESNPQIVYTLDLRCEKLKTVPILKEFKHLKVLDISSNNIIILENLQSLNELKELKIFDNELQNLHNLSNLKELVILQAQYNKIKDIGAGVLGSCKKLKQIRLDNNCLNTITVKEFSSCANLTYVDVSFNNLQSVSFITCLPNLEEFNASNNSIETLPDLSRCKKLLEIRLNNNVISNINGIKDHKSLTLLDVSNNTISSLFNLGVLNKIEYLNISNNRIPIDHFKIMETTFVNLEILNISKNGLKDIKKILEYVSNLKNLFELYMQDNDFPLIDKETNEQYNLSMIIAHLPNLHILDNVFVTKPNMQNNIEKGPLPMRPPTAVSGISFRQLENQFTNFTKETDQIQLQNKKCYNNIMDLLFTKDDDNLIMSKLKLSQSPRKTLRKSRLIDALTFASVNYINDEII